MAQRVRVQGVRDDGGEQDEVDEEDGDDEANAMIAGKTNGVYPAPKAIMSDVDTPPPPCCSWAAVLPKVKRLTRSVRDKAGSSEPISTR